MATRERSTTVQAQTQTLVISAPNEKTAAFRIIGTAPYVQNKFSQKSLDQMKEAQEAGSTNKKGKKKEAKDFIAAYEGAKHISTEGWCGIPAPAFRNAMIDCCRLVGFKMTITKMTVFAEADGYDCTDGTPLVRITKGEPEYNEMPVRLASGVCDIHPRPMWRPGWEAIVRIRYDADQFTLMDITNLLMRVGMQSGIGEGRPFSKNSNGMGWGLFTIANGE